MPDYLWPEIESELKYACRQRPADYSVLRPILLHNLKSKRIERILHNEAGLTIAAYVARVREMHAQHHDRVRALAANDDAAWQELYLQLYRAAFHFLRRAAISYQERCALAEEYAQEASLAIANTQFPYDVPFNYWAVAVLQAICSNGARAASALKRRAQRDALPLEEALITRPLSSGRHVGVEDQISRRCDIVHAVSRLGARERRVIIAWLVKGLSQTEIAKAFGISDSSVSRIKSRAFANLRLHLQNYAG